MGKAAGSVSGTLSTTRVSAILLNCAISIFVVSSTSGAASVRGPLIGGGPSTEGEAPGAPGKMGSWARPDKSAYSTTLNRPLWFTTVRGTLSEVMYPHTDRAQVRDSFLMIRGPAGFLDERIDFDSQAEREPGSLAYRYVNSNKSVRIEKQILIAPDRDAVIQDYVVKLNQKGPVELVYVHNPSAENTSGGDAIETQINGRGEPLLAAYQVDIRGDEPATTRPLSYQMVGWNLPQSESVVGFEGVNAPEDQIRNGSWPQRFQSASYGNVEGALRAFATGTEIHFRVVIAFANNASGNSNWRADLSNDIQVLMGRSYHGMLNEQTQEWKAYLAPLTYDRNDRLAEASILVVKALEDKWNRGALIAAPAIPWIPWFEEAPENDYEMARKRVGDANAGYHRVWPRDLYHKALSLLSVGDTRTPVDIALWYKKVQLRGWRNGAWSQNMWTDGTPSWEAFQIDQTGFPIVLVSRLVELGLVSYSDFQNMVIRAAEFIISAGPNTDQDRWEENGGVSPNSLAAAVEGLRAAGWLESVAGDPKQGAKYIEKADEWTRNLKSWTLVQNGAFGSGYFARIEVGGPKGWDPTQHSQVQIHNKGPGQRDSYTEDQILDGGFLEWIIAGLVDPRDGDFGRTIDLYDQHNRKGTRFGLGYIRYNYDAYGINHEGGAWPILNIERALTGLERKENIDGHLDFVRASASSGDLIPEQDTLSVRPLGWSHAAYLILKRSIHDGRSYYVPRRNIRTK